ncbi:hypothetical protein [Pseudomonas putida]|uniref:hypothetical protein n=1 Tax=Pseudomonas putida TaxID=303 RepID=UPI000FFC6E1C|nr:hypothetical protein [Pseudomonas putida]UZM95857.1 hypothetical protein OPZ46_10715 [Pseudomonas putida DOT-T1E]
MLETVYNLYYFIDEHDRALWLGHICYEIEGTEEEKEAFLLEAAERDYKSAKLTRAPLGMTRDSYNALARIGKTLTLFYYLFKEHEADDPLAIVTIIANGVPAINYRTSFKPTDMADVNERLGGIGEMDDWLVEYSKTGTFDFAELVNDDYLKAYKLLFNNRHYTSATKLFLSCIDSLAYVEFGDDGRGKGKRPVFCRWLDTYVDLEPVGVTAEELWELRNGLLHMSNLHSTQVQKKAVRRISISIGDTPADRGNPYDTTHYFNLITLYNQVAVGIGAWCETYIDNHDKFLLFVERWDRTVSDARLTKYYPD